MRAGAVVGASWRKLALIPRLHGGAARAGRAALCRATAAAPPQRALDAHGRVSALREPAHSLLDSLGPTTTILLSDVETDVWVRGVQAAPAASGRAGPGRANVTPLLWRGGGPAAGGAAAAASRVGGVTAALHSAGRAHRAPARHCPARRCRRCRPCRRRRRRPTAQWRAWLARRRAFWSRGAVRAPTSTWAAMAAGWCATRPTLWTQWWTPTAQVGEDRGEQSVCVWGGGGLSRAGWLRRLHSSPAATVEPPPTFCRPLPPSPP